MRATILRSVLLALVAAALARPVSDFPAPARGEAQKKQPAEQQEQKKPEYTISVEVPVVNVDVVITDNHGTFINGLKKENFRVLEDGVPQTVTNFAPTDAPITIVLLMEYSRLAYGYFAYQSSYWGSEFLNQLKPDDWVALVTYSMRPQIQVDFTRNKMEVGRAIYNLGFPDFTEANMIDALLDTVDRLQDVKGKKSVLLIASGLDTFSRHTLDDAIKQLKRTDVTIFCVGVGRDLFERADARGGLSDIGRLNYLQAQNEMTTFAKMTGGYAWFPRFEGELSSIFRQVAGALRNQYSLAYTPTNQARDGKYRKIKVEVVGNDGQPLVVVDQHGKKVKYYVYAREGYLAPKGSVGD